MNRIASQLEGAPTVGNGRVEAPDFGKAPLLPPPRRRRRRGLLALAVVLVVVGALGASYLATSLSRTSSVIAVARAVPRGQELTAADLVEARITVDPALAPIPYADRDRVIGMVAATDLTARSLLTRQGVTAARFPPAGQDLVGVGVKPGQLPTSPLRAGDHVLLVPVGTGNGAASSEPVPASPRPTVPATVARVGQPGMDGLRVVDVLVDTADGPDVATLASAGRLAIVVVPAD